MECTAPVPRVIPDCSAKSNTSPAGETITPASMEVPASRNDPPTMETFSIDASVMLKTASWMLRMPENIVSTLRQSFAMGEMGLHTGRPFAPMVANASHEIQIRP